MKIENCTIDDIDEIYRLYRIASAYQKSKEGVIVWPEFERKLVEDSISENRQWKLTIDNKIACVWTITFSDEQIWEEKMAMLLSIFIVLQPIPIIEVKILWQSL